jgi:hypothetical protein
MKKTGLSSILICSGTACCWSDSRGAATGEGCTDRLSDHAGVTSDVQLKELRPTAVALKRKLEEIDTQLDAKGLEIAFQTAKQKQVNAIMTFATRTFFAERKRIVELAVKYRLPAIYFQKDLSMRAA